MLENGRKVRSLAQESLDVNLPAKIVECGYRPVAMRSIQGYRFPLGIR